MDQNPCIPMTQASLSLPALLAAAGAALITLPGAALAQSEAMEVISLRNPCEEGTPFSHEYGTSVMMQYGYRSCPVPLF
jgi:hypothetical protein